ncbi:MAG TPA: type II toxin-antitoxin system VapC family toxin [Caulobacteraceae bacterium]
MLDTNVLSEGIKPAPDHRVLRWLDQVDEDVAFISVVTLAELRRGAERLVQGARRRRLEDWISSDVTARFAGRILAIDEQIADHWGHLVAVSESIGRRIGVIDGFLAATADRHNLTLVTRNVADFAPLGFSIINPWES